MPACQTAANTAGGSQPATGRIGLCRSKTLNLPARLLIPAAGKRLLCRAALMYRKRCMLVQAGAEVSCSDVSPDGTLPSMVAARFRRAERVERVQAGTDGRGHCRFSVPSISCGKCIGAVERALVDCEGVVAARANLTLRQVALTLRDPQTDPLPALEKLEARGYPATLLDPAAPADASESGVASTCFAALPWPGLALPTSCSCPSLFGPALKALCVISSTLCPP